MTDDAYPTQSLDAVLGGPRAGEKQGHKAAEANGGALTDIPTPPGSSSDRYDWLLWLAMPQFVPFFSIAPNFASSSVQVCNVIQFAMLIVKIVFCWHSAFTVPSHRHAAILQCHSI